jgi:hypothetical protein
VCIGVTLVMTAPIADAGQKKEKKALERDLTPEQLTVMVDEYRHEIGEELQELINTSLRRIDREYKEHRENGAPFVHDILLISGGGAKGAFAAGLLEAWGTVESGPTARPDFDVVTGVSTGALIAPFAFIGTQESYASVAKFYADPQENWVKKRGKLYILPHHISLFNDLALQDYIKEQYDEAILQQVAERAAEDRLLLIGATNLDIGIGHVFDLSRESQRAQQDGSLDRIHSILLASSALPGLFPPVEIDDFYYADGGVTAQIFFVHSLEQAHGPLTKWRELYPDAPLPKFRLWIILNESLRLQPIITQPRWGSVATRSLTTLMRSSLLASLRNIEEVARESAGALGLEFEFRFVAIPDDAPEPPHKTMFDKEFMTQLEELGRKMGADPASWRSEVPEIHWFREF